MASENEAIVVVEEGEEFSQISEDFEYDINIPPPQLPNTQHKRDLWAEWKQEYRDWKVQNAYNTEDDSDYEPSRKCLKNMQDWEEAAEDREEAAVHVLGVQETPEYFKRLLEKHKRSGDVKHRSYSNSQKNALNAWMAHEYTGRDCPVWYDAQRKTGISRLVLKRMWSARHIIKGV
jgi:hypothetical protein